ncbi:MAG: B12-binding domain-containing radical SAM protein [Thermodesulfovibrionales bacterium]
MALIYPPVAKPCEPPAGISRLSGMLSKHGVQHRVLDANMEGLLYLLRRPLPSEKAEDVWTRRAFRNRERDLSALRDPLLYRHLDRYKRAVRDLGRVLTAVSPGGSTTGLVNYEQEGLSPVRSGDLLTAAERHELSPFYPYFRARLQGLFREKEPSMVGISLNYLSQALCAFSMIGFLRREFPGAKVILGGGLVTSWLKNPRWKNHFSGLVDHLVAGPGEFQLLSLLGLDLTGAEMPQPNYLAFPIHQYLSPGFVLPYSAATGCYWNRCTFCPEQAEDNTYAAIPSPQVIADIEDLAVKTKPVLVHLLDNAISPALLDAIAMKSAEGARVPWYGFSRIGFPLTDPDFCEELKRSGCVMLKLGIESGEQGVLDALEKGITVEMASVVLKNLKKAGIATYVYLIFGTPVETESAARKTLEFTVHHRDSINFLNLAIFNLPVCGALPSEIETKGFYQGDLSLYTDFTHPYGWDRRRVRLFLDDEFRRHPAILSVLRNDPPQFTSNHSPFFVMGNSGWGRAARTSNL